MSYRPKDWNKIKDEFRQRASEEDWEREDIFEGGADAIIVALKKHGMHFDGEMTFNGFFHGSLYTLRNKDNTGTYVFIPDDSVEEK